MRVAMTLAVLAVMSFAGCSSTPRAGDAATIDTPAALCDACRADQICVAKYDGTCRALGVTCEARMVDCPGNACSSACEAAYCEAPLQCQNRAPCGGEPPAAFTCYGP